MFTKLALRKWPKCCSRKKNTKSVIWKYFGLEADDKGNPKDADSPKYKLCFQKVTARFGNISNLYLHIRTTHPVVHKDLQAEKAEKPPTKSRKSEHQDSEDSTGQMTIKECLGKGKKLSKDSREFKELTRSVSECLAKEMLPLNTVDRAGFRAMLHTFNPRYTLPTRSYFSRVAIPSLYSETRAKIEKDLSTSKVEYFSELWSSPSMEPYMSYTLHYIDSEWNLKAFAYKHLIHLKIIKELI